MDPSANMDIERNCIRTLNLFLSRNFLIDSLSPPELASQLDHGIVLPLVDRPVSILGNAL